jgi:hypothetical protein
MYSDLDPIHIYVYPIHILNVILTRKEKEK